MKRSPVGAHVSPLVTLRDVEGMISLVAERPAGRPTRLVIRRLAGNGVRPVLTLWPDQAAKLRVALTQALEAVEHAGR